MSGGKKFLVIVAVLVVLWWAAKHPHAAHHLVHQFAQIGARTGKGH